RGPGEQQLEYDRRLIRERIEKINERLGEERKSREVRSARLKDNGPPKVALVGYTNAGKTTILNALSGVDRSTRDRLFETLETTTRRVAGESSTAPVDNRNSEHNGGNGSIPGGSRPDFVLTDTVGFIRKLPTQLVHSFASTLGAAWDADIVVLCADAGSTELEDEIRTVRQTLAESFGEEEILRKEPLLCLNKTDLLSEHETEMLRAYYPDAVMISAYEYATPLLERVYGRISASRLRLEILIPHAEYGKAARLYGLAEIHGSHHTQDGLWMDVTLPEYITGEYRGYRVA
nr:50S ribosome-binding GTPase [Rubrobacter sp.]